MWLQKHWRLVAGGIFAVLAGIAILALLVFFPPALPFFAGFIALSASALIPIVTVLAMAAAAFVATLFNVVSQLLSKGKTKQGFGLVDYEKRKAIYGPLTALAITIAIGVAAFLVTALVGLIGGAAFLSAPLWAAAGTALAIGVGIGALLHLAFFGSLRLDNYFAKNVAEKDNFEAKPEEPKPNSNPELAPQNNQEHKQKKSKKYKEEKTPDHRVTDISELVGSGNNSQAFSPKTPAASKSPALKHPSSEVKDAAVGRELSFDSPSPEPQKKIRNSSSRKDKKDKLATPSAEALSDATATQTPSRKDDDLSAKVLARQARKAVKSAEKAAKDAMSPSSQTVTPP